MPAKMLAATTAYNDALTAMVSDLAATYYGKAKLTKEDVAAYVKTLKSAAEFRHRLDNPTNEPTDSLDALEAPSVVSNDLEDTIEQMVEAVSGDSDKFDFAAWEKQWETARKTGDKPEQAEAGARGGRDERVSRTGSDAAGYAEREAGQGGLRLRVVGCGRRTRVVDAGIWWLDPGEGCASMLVARLGDHALDGLQDPRRRRACAGTCGRSGRAGRRGRRRRACRGRSSRDRP